MRRLGVWCNRVWRAARVVLVVAAIAVVVTITAAARSSRRTGMGVIPRPTTTTTESVGAAQARLAAALHFSPTPGTSAVDPNAAVVVQAGVGRLVSVTVTAASGVEHYGSFVSPTLWHSHEQLQYGTTYHVNAMVSDGRASVVRSATFQTMTPSLGVTASVFPNSGLTLGVGQPVVFRFSHAITDPAARAAVASHILVTLSQPVPGGLYWFSPTELHFRPKSFWPIGEDATVQWDFAGWNVGGGFWGEGSGVTQFVIGPSRVSYVNLDTHQMSVTLNGRTIAVYRISGGKPKDPTMSGVHIVLDRESVVHMVSSTVGIPVNSPDGYDELVYEDVHISDSGEYVHAAPWSVASQGVTNVSHGCVNLSPADATSFFNFSRVGDVVLIAGSPRPPAVGDHGVMDWDTPWTAFMPAHVVAASGPHFTPTHVR